MRNYATISPMFWMRGSGKSLRGHPDAQLVALYLMTAPTSEMVGIYHVYPDTIARETGLSVEQVDAALVKCAELDIAHYDDEAELVWVPAMAKYQIGESLGTGKSGKPDRRIAGVVKQIAPYKGHRFYDEFLRRYGEAYSLFEFGEISQTPPKPPTSPLDGGAGGDEGGSGTEISPRVPVRDRDRDRVPDSDQGGAGGEAKPRTKAARKTEFPEGWKPNVTHVAKALELGLDLPKEATKFENSAIANGRRYANWDRAFHTWLDNAPSFAPRGAGPPSRAPQRQPPNPNFDVSKYDAQR